MGSSLSKVAKSTTSSTMRNVSRSTAPGRPKPPATVQSPASQSPAAAHARPSASESKDQHVELDGRDPDFGSRLSRIGPVQPASAASNFVPPNSIGSTTSAHSESNLSHPLNQRQHLMNQSMFPPPTSRSNPALQVVEAREKFAKIAMEEIENMGRPSFQGRSLISASELRTLLELRDDAKKSPGEIERQLRLRPGLVAKLGPAGMVGNA